MEQILPAFEQDNIAVVFATNDYFVPYMATMIYSIIVNGSKENNYDLVVLHSGVKEEDRSLLKQVVSAFPNVCLRFAHVGDTFAGVKLYTGGKKPLTEETYYRLLIPELMGAYEKVLYLDADMVALADVAELFRTELGDALLASTRDLCGLIDYFNPLTDLKAYREKELALKEPEDYFIAGMLLMNIPALRESFTTAQLLERAAERDWRCHDQDVLNVLCQGRVKLVDAAWDVMVPEMIQYLPPARRQELEESLAAPKLLHFAGLRKPWLYLDTPFSEEFWRYAAQTPYMLKILRRRLDQSGPADTVRTAMEQEFLEGKAGARYILRFCRAWLQYKLHRGG